MTEIVCDEFGEPTLVIQNGVVTALKDCTVSISCYCTYKDEMGVCNSAQPEIEIVTDEAKK